ncbi:MAG: signal peptidase II [Patescibacteria group bacterium]
MLIKCLVVNLLALLLFIIDRILKLYFVENPTIVIGGDFFWGLLNFEFAKNFGIAFGILFTQIILVPFVVVITLILFSFLINAYQKRNFWEIGSLTFIIAGAISNLFDRLRFGYVIDYINVPWFTVFNLADCLITTGVIILIFDVWFKPKLVNKKSL